MKIKFSDHDRAIISTSNRQVPWQGVEDVVVARYELGEALQLEAFTKAHGAAPIDKLSREPTFTATLTPKLAELLIFVVAGGGQGMNGEHGPKLGALISRIRKTFPKPAPPKA